MDQSTFGLRYWLVPYIDYCFCFLFEDPNDSVDCSKMVHLRYSFNMQIHTMSAYYPRISQPHESKGKGLLGPVIGGIQNVHVSSLPSFLVLSGESQQS